MSKEVKQEKPAIDKAEIAAIKAVKDNQVKTGQLIKK